MRMLKAFVLVTVLLGSGFVTAAKGDGGENLPALGSPASPGSGLQGGFCRVDFFGYTSHPGKNGYKDGRELNRENPGLGLRYCYDNNLAFEGVVIKKNSHNGVMANIGFELSADIYRRGAFAIRPGIGAFYAWYENKDDNKNLNGIVPEGSLTAEWNDFVLGAVAIPNKRSKSERLEIESVTLFVGIKKRF